MTFQIVAIVILLAFYGCYLGKMLLQKKQGIQTDQMGKGKKGTEKTIELTMKTATFSVLAAELISIYYNTFLPFTAIQIGGLFLAALGDFAFIISVLTMKNNWRAGVSHTDKTELVTDGIYQISRNPAFLGFDLVYIGILLTFFNWLLLAVSLFAILMFHLQITKVEEPFLTAVFGTEYSKYQESVHRYFGKVRPKHPSQNIH